ncbi:MAG TPA: N-acetyltransferase [Trueperaceae bacterium]|nr:N-acetyltransferase [Trueperaceae bacterium]
MGFDSVVTRQIELQPKGPIQVRNARSEDVPLIFENIGYWAGQGRMLVRPMQNIFENLRDFFVAEVMTAEGPRFAGNGALHILWGDIAEVRGLAVAPEVRATGVGRALVAATEVEARRVGIPVLFAWTYEVGFFERCGFKLIDKTRELHPRVWSECLRCPFYVGCNENGVVKRLEDVPFPLNLPEPPPAQVPPGIR